MADAARPAGPRADGGPVPSPAPPQRDPGAVPGAGAVVRRTLVIVVTAATVVLLLFVWYVREVLLLAFAGVLFAIFLRRLATRVRADTPLTPTWALTVVALALVGALVGVFWARGPGIAEEVRTLREQLPQAAESLEVRLARYDWGQRAIEQAPSPEALLPDNPDAISRVTGVASRTFGAAASFAVILFLGLVLATTPGVYVRGVLALLPERTVPRASFALDLSIDRKTVYLPPALTVLA